MSAADELLSGLRDGIVPFWSRRAPDGEHAGFLTSFDGDGELRPGRHDKYLNTQARLVWAFSELAPFAADPDRCLTLAREGLRFLVDRFRDPPLGGWFWKVTREGVPLDDAKLTYGQSFALYATACHARHTGDERAAELAVTTFEELRQHAYDDEHGGYRENMDRAWSPVIDRRSLDVHMHLLEAFAELVRLTGDGTHIAALREVRSVLVDRMVDRVTGAGGNQFSASFEPLVPIVIPKTWIDERPAAEQPPPATAITTSYGHNLELAWLLADADTTLGEAGASDVTIARLADHAYTYGFDRLVGGVFREGPLDGPATDRDKEFWQNSESLVGWLEAHRATGDARYLEAFQATWRFAQRHLVHPDFGEWRVRVSEDGAVMDGDLGNDWKVCYHTGRAALESVRRLAP